MLFIIHFCALLISMWLIVMTSGHTQKTLLLLAGTPLACLGLGKCALGQILALPSSVWHFPSAATPSFGALVLSFISRSVHSAASSCCLDSCSQISQMQRRPIWNFSSDSSHDVSSAVAIFNPSAHLDRERSMHTARCARGSPHSLCMANTCCLHNLDTCQISPLLSVSTARNCRALLSAFLL